MLLSLNIDIFCFALGDNWEFVKPFVPTAFLIYISSLTKIILDKKLPRGYLLNFLLHMDYYRFSWILIKTSLRSSLLNGNLRFYSRFGHRGKGQFFARGTVNYLLWEFSQAAHFFTKQSKEMTVIRCNNIGLHMKWKCFYIWIYYMSS